MSESGSNYKGLAEPPTISPMTSSPSRSLDYYWDTIILQVEDTLFRIPKYHLAGKSEIFDSMLSLPQGSNKPEGSSDDAPIKLENISKIDFEHFLQVLYPRDTMNLPELSIDGWISILRLSSLWRMGNMRSTAIERLTPSLCDESPEDRILLGRKYSVAHWISSGYVDLAKHEGVVSLEQAGRIGLGTALLIQHVREALWRSDNKGWYRFSRSYRTYQTSEHNNQCIYKFNDNDYDDDRKGMSADELVEHAIESAFREELKDVEAEGDGFKD